MESAERTPETVLRAMLRAYEEDALKEARPLFSGEGGEELPSEPFEHAVEAWSDVLESLAIVLESGVGSLVFIHGDIERDYLDRLSGARPLDAPPRSIGGH